MKSTTHFQVRKQVLKALMLICVFILLTFSIHKSIGSKGIAIRTEKQRTLIADGAFYIFATHYLLTNPSPHLYTIEYQQELFSALTKQNRSFAMPLNTTPTFIVVLAPFAIISSTSLTLALSMWIGFSITAIVAVFTELLIDRPLMRSLSTLCAIFLLAACVVSYSSLVTVLLGQTSLLHTACLLLLCRQRTEHSNGRFSWILDALGLLCLSIKPQFLFLGLGILIVLRRPQSLMRGMILIFLVLLALAPFIGFTWPLDYVRNLRMYGNEKVNVAYQWAFAPQLMNVFVSPFYRTSYFQIAGAASWLLLGSLYLAIILASLRNSWGNKEQIRKPFSIAVLLCSYLLFAPHSGFYEEILWAVPIYIACFPRSGTAIISPTLLIAGAGVFLLVNRLAITPAGEGLIEWYILKCVVALLLLRHILVKKHLVLE